MVIAGLIALGAGGYAAWVDPDMAERIPKDVKASIKRHLPAGGPGNRPGPRASEVACRPAGGPVPGGPRRDARVPGQQAHPDQRRAVAALGRGARGRAQGGRGRQPATRRGPSGERGPGSRHRPADRAGRKEPRGAGRGRLARADGAGPDRDPRQHRGCLPQAGAGEGDGRRRARRGGPALRARRRHDAGPASAREAEEAAGVRVDARDAATPRRRRPRRAPRRASPGAPILE